MSVLGLLNRVVSRRSWLFGGVIGVSVLGKKLSIVGPAATRPTRVFYVHPGGNDDHSGREQRTPWKTLVRANRAMADGEIIRGDTLLLAAGRIHYGSLIPNTTRGSGYLTISAYGDGAAPIVTAYKTALQTGWVQAGTNRWSLSLAAHSGAYTGNIASPRANAGFIKVQDRLYGDRKDSSDQLRRQWDFVSSRDSSEITVWSDGNPSAGAIVEIAVDEPLLQGASHLSVHGIHFTGTGAHGYTDGPGIQQVILKNNVFSRIGGSALDATTRYGNGVQIWQAGSDITISNNLITQCFDAGTTIQGHTGPWRNIRFTDNVISLCNQAFEVWTRGQDGREARFSGCVFAGNTCIDSGYGWGYRPSQKGRGCHFLLYELEIPVEISVEYNVLHKAREAIYYIRQDNGTAGGAIPPGWHSNNNTIVWPRGLPILYGAAPVFQTPETFSERTGHETNSTFVHATPER